MSNIVQFNPVKVVKPFLSLEVGDVLTVNPGTGCYTFRYTSEDIGEGEYSWERFNISLAPYVIEHWKEYFVKLDEDGKEIVDTENILKEINEHKVAIGKLEQKLGNKSEKIN